MKRKLYKLEQGKKVCGVCGGIAEYFGFDASILRIIWAALILLWGSGILLYFLVAFILPNKSEVDTID